VLIHEVGGTEARADFLHSVGVRALAMFHMPAPEWVSPSDLLVEAKRHAPGAEVFLSEDGMVWGV